jgi:hypothetical protein
MLYVVIERYRPGQAPAVYRRFRERGRMAPDGVRYVSSWVDLEFRRCFQVMEAPDDDALRAWTKHWDDLVEFEIVPVRTSAEAAEEIARVEPSALPIACTLSAGELEARRDALLPGLLAKARGREFVPGGVRLRFDAVDGLIEEIAKVVAAEHRCCAFLQFDLRVEPGDGAILLEVTGPEGTESFLGGLP